MMAIEKLSASKVARISTPGKYGDGNGLYLYVSKNMTKSWVFRYQLNYTEHYMGLGPIHAVNIKEAREEARKARILLVKRVNPLKVRKAKADPVGILIEQDEETFDECVISYIAQHKYEWKSAKHLKQWESSLRTYATPYFGNIPVCEVTTELVLQALEPIWLNKTVTAFRLRERIERVLSWATIRGYRDGDNPARWEGHLQELLPNPSRIKAVRHFTSMPYQEIGNLLRKLDVHGSAVAKALQFTILTASRTSEALYAKWQEIDFAQQTWVIPSERMKNGRQHRVPLSEMAVGLLRSQEGCHPDWVFPNSRTGRPYSGSVMLDLLKSMGFTDVTVHGFRAAFRVWAAERACPKEVAEMALAHKQASPVEEAYQRSDLFERRRALMQEWADSCLLRYSPT